MKKRPALTGITNHSLGEADCDATIAICTYNRIGTLPRTLQSLSWLRGDRTFEVIVVNGPSTDGTSEFLASQNGITLLENSEVNLSISRNIAIANASGRFIAFIDDDAIPEPDWLSLLLDRFENDEELSALGGFIRDSNGISFQTRYVFCDALGKAVACDNPDYISFQMDERGHFPSLTGTNVIFRTADIRRVNGFDENYAYFLDETDVNKRMNDAGLKSDFLPQAEIHHKYAASHLRTAKKTATNMYPIARSVAYFAARHGARELGWTAVTDHLTNFYKNEFGWKMDDLLAGDVTHQQWQNLLHQIERGIIDGIDAAFASDEDKVTQRLARHVQPLASPRVIQRMRSPDKTLRLCMFSQDHAKTNIGGIGRWTNLVAKGLAERGHEVTVIGELSDPSKPEYADFTEYGFWSHNIHHFEREAANEIDCLGLPTSLANASKRRLSEFRRIQPRRNFQVASTPIWDVEGAALLGAGDVPTVLSLHTCAGLMLDYKPEWQADQNYFNNHIRRLINAEIQALRRTPLILANSAAILRDIDAVYRLGLEDRPHRIVPHGIEDIEAPDGLLEAREAAREDDPTLPVRILFLGRLEKRKGIKDVVYVADRLLARGLPIHLDLVGDKVDDENDQLVADLARRHPTRVTRHGYLTDEELDPLMRQGDILFCPSLYESFGLIYAEAMRYSMPCIAYDTGGVPEVVEHGVDGLLSKLGDRTGLETTLIQLITNRDMRVGMSQAARANFIAKFNYKLMAERLEEAYRSDAVT